MPAGARGLILKRRAVVAAEQPGAAEEVAPPGPSSYQAPGVGCSPAAATLDGRPPAGAASANRTAAAAIAAAIALRLRAALSNQPSSDEAGGSPEAG